MVPKSSTETTHFTPSALAEVDPKPVFRFKAVTERDADDVGVAMAEDGLTLYSEDAWWDEVERGIRANWSDADSEIIKLRSIRDAVVQSATDPSVVVSEDEAADYVDRLEQLTEIHPPLRKIRARNIRFENNFPLLLLSMFMTGWSGIDVEWKREAGRIPQNTIAQIRSALAEIEAAHGLEQGVAWLQVVTHAMGLMNLTKDEEKNSSSPLSAPSTPNGSGKTPAKRAGGNSKTSGTSKKTRRAR